MGFHWFKYKPAKETRVNDHFAEFLPDERSVGRRSKMLEGIPSLPRNRQRTEKRIGPCVFGTL